MPWTLNKGKWLYKQKIPCKSEFLLKQWKPCKLNRWKMSTKQGHSAMWAVQTCNNALDTLAVYRTAQNGNTNRENPVMWAVRNCNNALDILVYRISAK